MQCPSSPCDTPTSWASKPPMAAGTCAALSLSCSVTGSGRETAGSECAHEVSGVLAGPNEIQAL